MTNNRIVPTNNFGNSQQMGCLLRATNNGKEDKSAGKLSRLSMRDSMQQKSNTKEVKHAKKRTRKEFEEDNRMLVIDNSANNNNGGV